MLTARVAKRQDTRQLLHLMSQLASLAETVARLRDTQHQAARARAARLAAQQLHAYVVRVTAPQTNTTRRDHLGHYPLDLTVGRLARPDVHPATGQPPRPSPRRR